MIGLIAKTGLDKYKNLNNDEKNLTKIGIALSILSLGFLGYRTLSKMSDVVDTITFKKSREEQKKAEQRNIQNIDSALSKSKKPTLSVLEAKSIADALYQAFLNTQPSWSANLWDEGTDEDAVYNSLKRIPSKSDFLLISKLYQMPRGRNLNAELNYELNASEMATVRNILQKINVKI